MSKFTDRVQPLLPEVIFSEFDTTNKIRNQLFSERQRWRRIKILHIFFYSSSLFKNLASQGRISIIKPILLKESYHQKKSLCD
jgi:hypothetical protein